MSTASAASTPDRREVPLKLQLDGLTLRLGNPATGESYAVELTPAIASQLGNRLLDAAVMGDDAAREVAVELERVRARG